MKLPLTMRAYQRSVPLKATPEKTGVNGTSGVK